MIFVIYSLLYGALFALGTTFLLLYDCTEDTSNATSCAFEVLGWIFILLGIIILLVYIALGICAMFTLHNFYKNLKNRDKLLPSFIKQKEGGEKNQMYWRPKEMILNIPIT